MWLKLEYIYKAYSHELYKTYSLYTFTILSTTCAGWSYVDLLGCIRQIHTDEERLVAILGLVPRGSLQNTTITQWFTHTASLRRADSMDFLALNDSMRIPLWGWYYDGNYFHTTVGNLLQATTARVANYQGMRFLHSYDTRLLLQYRCRTLLLSFCEIEFSRVETISHSLRSSLCHRRWLILK